MFYVVGKIVFSFVAPSNLSLLLLGAGLGFGWFQRWQRLGRRLALTGFALLLVFGFSPIGKWLAKPLEDRFSESAPVAATLITHIVLLGGFELADLAKWRGQLAVNSAGERLLSIPVLARRFPDAKIVFTGGFGDLLGERLNAIDEVRSYLVGAGVAADRIVLEGRSRTTWENALFTRDLPEVRDGACPCGFLLVTSAWHMPRAIGAFRQAGFGEDGRQLYAWPVDYRTGGGRSNWAPFGWLHEGLSLSDLAVKEWIGLLAYWFKGQSSALWPGPREIPTG